MTIKPPPQETNWLTTTPGRELLLLLLAIASAMVIASLLSGLNPLVGLLSGFTALFATAVLLAIYMLPTIVARLRRHRNLLTVAVLNLLFGWTLIGWGLLMGYALLVQERSDEVHREGLQQRRSAEG